MSSNADAVATLAVKDLGEAAKFYGNTGLSRTGGDDEVIVRTLKAKGVKLHVIVARG